MQCAAKNSSATTCHSCTAASSLLTRPSFARVRSSKRCSWFRMGKSRCHCSKRTAMSTSNSKGLTSSVITRFCWTCRHLSATRQVIARTPIATASSARSSCLYCRPSRMRALCSCTVRRRDESKCEGLSTSTWLSPQFPLTRTLTIRSETTVTVLSTRSRPTLRRSAPLNS